MVLSFLKVHFIDHNVLTEALTEYHLVFIRHKKLRLGYLVEETRMRKYGSPNVRHITTVDLNLNIIFGHYHFSHDQGVLSSQPN